jgi:hypothetical protein
VPPRHDPAACTGSIQRNRRAPLPRNGRASNDTNRASRGSKAWALGQLARKQNESRLHPQAVGSLEAAFAQAVGFPAKGSRPLRRRRSSNDDLVAELAAVAEPCEPSAASPPTDVGEVEVAERGNDRALEHAGEDRRAARTLYAKHRVAPRKIVDAHLERSPARSDGVEVRAPTGEDPIPVIGMAPNRGVADDPAVVFASSV